jgi:plastocyanin
MRHPRALRVAALAAVVVIGLSGCGSSGGSSNSAGSTTKSPASSASGGGASSPSMSAPSSKKPSSPMAMLSIKDFAFDNPTSVKPGAKVMVSNSDTSTHSVTSDQTGMFDVDVSAGGTATFTAPSKPGSYPYHCKYHGNMHATLVVK